MLAAVIDTHALLWHLYDDDRLSQRVREFMETTRLNGDQIAIPSIGFVEVVYLIEKGRIACESLSVIAELLSHARSLFAEVSLDLQIARALSRVDARQVPDMPDRIIAATALHFGIPAISHHRRITLSTITTIW